MIEILELALEKIRAFREEFRPTRAELADMLRGTLRSVESPEAGCRRFPSRLPLAFAADVSDANAHL
jgi:hypothetical protein